MARWMGGEIDPRELRAGLRQLRLSPGFTAVAVITLALGIGANTAIFSVMNAVLLRFLPVHDPERLVTLHTSGHPADASQTGFDDTSFSLPVFERLRAERGVFSDLVGYVPLGFDRVAVRVGVEPEEAAVDMVTGNYFAGLGVRPVRGRVFSLDDERRHAQVAVVSDAWWRRRMAGDPAVLGRPIQVKGVPFTVVGVAAPGFAGTDPESATDVWLPFQDRPDVKPWGLSAEDPESLYHSPRWWFLMAIGRLAPGVSARQAAAQLAPPFERAAYEGGRPPGARQQRPRLSLAPARGIPGQRDAYERPLAVLMAMVGLVQLIACGNVAMLLLARNAARRGEFGVRLALGCGAGRLFRQLLGESVLLVGGGSVLGWLFALAATRALAAWSGLGFSLAPDRSALAFTLMVSLASGLVFGVVPLGSALRVPIRSILGSARTTGSQAGGRNLGAHAMIAAQVAFCLILLVGAGLLVRTLRNLEHRDLGLRSSGLLVFGISPQQGAAAPGDRSLLYRALLDRLRALPGIESATAMGNRIGAGVSNNTTAVIDGAVAPGDTGGAMRWNSVGADYFHVLGTPVLLGRDFTGADGAKAPRVAIVNRTLVERFLPHRPPLGHHIALSKEPGAEQFTIVGVVADSRYASVREKERPMAYFPYAQLGGVSTLHVELRAQGDDPEALLPAVRRAVAELAPGLPLLQPMTQREQFERSFQQERLLARIALCFGGLAALLVSAGLLGTLSFRVSRRTPEIGLRMALGARRGDVLWMVLRGSLWLTMAGIAAGTPLAYAVAGLLRAQLYDLQPGDPASFAVAVLGMTLVAVAASLLPGCRAASIDPMRALRSE